MTCSALVAFAHAEGIGRKAILEVRSRKQIGLEQDGNLLTTPEFDTSVARAYDHALRMLGQPGLEGGFWWALRPTPGDFVPIGNPDGGSLYGAFAMTFLQAIARTTTLSLDDMRSQIRDQLPAIREARLSKVAISSEGEEHTGDFCRTGGMAQKIARLSELSSAYLTTCIVCRAQEDIPPVVPFTVLMAHDPVDAFARLFELQAFGILRRVL